MTNHPNMDRGTLFDLPFETARERIVDLQASASPGAPRSVVEASPRQSPLRRLRSALGSRLIVVGRTLVADDPAGQSVTRT